MARKFASPLLFGVLLLTVIIAYLPALHGAFLWDDSGHITAPALQSVAGLWRIWTSPGATQQYYPLTHTLFWIEHRLWGDEVLGYHLVNILLHVTSAWLLMRLLQRLEIPGAELAAFIFALHPMNVESVAWISELKNSLSTPLYLAAALRYLSFDRSRERRDYLFALALFVLALLAKTVTVTLPVSLLVVLWWRRGSLRLREDFAPLAPFMLIGVFAGFLTSYVERTYIGAAGLEFTLSPMERIAVAGRATEFYLETILVPAKLAFFYPRWEVHPWLLLPAMAVLAVIVFCWWIRKRTRSPLAVALCFCVALFPALGFVDVYPFRYSFVANHFAYLATIPIITAVAAVVSRYRASIIIPVVLALLTFNEARAYKDPETLYRTNIARRPTAWLPHNNLALLLYDRGDRAEARAHLMEALRLGPNTAEHHLNVGRVLVDEGALDEARTHFERAIALDPSFADAHNNLGVLLLRQNHPAEAIESFERALTINPQLAEARVNLVAAHQTVGVGQAQAGHMDSAAAHFQAAVALAPEDAGLRYNLGTALLALGKRSEAITELQSALRIRPDFPEAAANLAAAQNLR